jgi:hypothetical protein
MANKNDLFDFDETSAVNNDNVQGANIAENCAPSGINNAIRGLAAIVKRAIGSQGSAIASATTTAIGAAGTALYTTITGTTPITSLGSVGAGTLRIVEFTGVLTLTHNATSLKLPGSANITTGAGDVGFFLSLGSGNWKCLHYSKADGSAVANFSGTLTSTDPSAADAPIFEAFRNSGSPAANDEIGQLSFTGNNSAISKVLYGAVDSIILDPTAGSEDSVVRLVSVVAGAAQAALQAANGVNIGAPAGGFKGAGALNAAAGVYIAGHGTIAQVVRDVETAYITCGTIMPIDDTIPQNTEGDEILSVSITPTNAASTLLIIVDLNVQLAVASGLFASAIFVDSVSNAIAGRVGTSPTTGRVETSHYTHSLSAGGTAVRTYKLRAGSATATDLKINGDDATRLLGGVMSSSLTVIEVLPQ